MMPLWALELSDDIWHKPFDEYVPPKKTKTVTFSTWNHLQLLYHRLTAKFKVYHKQYNNSRYKGYVKLKSF